MLAGAERQTDFLDHPNGDRVEILWNLVDPGAAADIPRHHPVIVCNSFHSVTDVGTLRNIWFGHLAVPRGLPWFQVVSPDGVDASTLREYGPARWYLGDYDAELKRHRRHGLGPIGGISHVVAWAEIPLINFVDIDRLVMHGERCFVITEEEERWRRANIDPTE